MEESKSGNEQERMKMSADSKTGGGGLRASERGYEM